ncbi:DUF3383 family protein [Lactobacillus xujianguonis]|uniref:DUF3383 family protein n=2 Tax=Lactobacillaceae TaxID=33958 RepID=A0A437ST66_9LACO|nr:DUF3383 family protein [Lactobacillus xujianguonis]RVU73468.1 DUF3383 family protein [Lactobacillus xujianguonis]
MADGKVVGPFEHTRDVNVIMTVVHPRPVIGLGNLLILNLAEAATLNKTKPKDVAPASADDTPQGSQPKNNDSTNTQAGSNDQGSAPKSRAFSNVLSNSDRMNGLLLRKVDTATGSMYREYSNLDAVEVDYAKGTPVYKKAAAYFAQDNHSDRVAVLDYPKDKLEDSLKNFWTFNWTFAIFSENKFSDETVLASNIFEANQDHFLVLQTDDLGTFNPYYGQNFTIGLDHDLDEPMDAAFVGAIATLPVGSTTWKFKALKGITPDEVTVAERAGMDSAHTIGYIISDGRPETSEGFTLSGEYIDLLHGEIWVKTYVGSDLVDLLHKNNKIPYDAEGIRMIKSTIESRLLDAYNRGIIQEIGETGKGDYVVTTTPREEQSLQDKSKRHYGGASFTYHASSAIHTITVNGVVNSDTIMS